MNDFDTDRIEGIVKGFCDVMRMRQYVCTYGVDRSFLTLCNYDHRLERNLGITLPAAETYTSCGSVDSPESIACLEGFGQTLKNLGKFIWKLIQDGIAWIKKKATDFLNWLKNFKLWSKKAQAKGSEAGPPPSTPSGLGFVDTDDRTTDRKTTPRNTQEPPRALNNSEEGNTLGNALVFPINDVGTMKRFMWKAIQSFKIYIAEDVTGLVAHFSSLTNFLELMSHPVATVKLQWDNLDEIEDQLRHFDDVYNNIQYVSVAEMVSGHFVGAYGHHQEDLQNLLIDFQQVNNDTVIKELEEIQRFATARVQQLIDSPEKQEINNLIFTADEAANHLKAVATFIPVLVNRVKKTIAAIDMRLTNLLVEVSKNVQMLVDFHNQTH